MLWEKVIVLCHRRQDMKGDIVIVNQETAMYLLQHPTNTRNYWYSSITNPCMLPVVSVQLRKIIFTSGDEEERVYICI